MKLVSVILDIPTQALDTPYTYVASEAQDCEIGCCVVVPFGHRHALGFVIEVREYEEGCLSKEVDPAKLKAVLQVVSKPYFDEEGAACARYLSEYYVAPLSSCVRLFTPPGGVPRMSRSRSGSWQLKDPVVGEVDDRWVVPGPAFKSFSPRANAVKQKAVVEALQAGELRVAELTAEYGSVSTTLKSLEKQGVICVEHRRRMRGCLCPKEPAPQILPTLTPGQTEALAVIESAVSAQCGEVVLVDGVTGSGKTEVYLRAIESVLVRGRTACVLVPEISLTPQTVARFRGRFGNQVAVMHSRMSQGERFDQWDFIRSGQARVVVGARSALFTPLKNLGVIVIDEEHEGSYKQDSAPRYHARDVAVWMARRAGATVVLGSATPCIETLHACKTNDSWHRVELPKRANGQAMPTVRVVDMAAEFGSGSRSMFSYALSSALEKELSSGHKAVLLLNQRGFAKFLLCRECGFVPECSSCSTSLTYHERGNFLACHHCGHRMPTLPVCPQCGSPYLRKFGAGTQRVEDELRVLLDAMPDVGPSVPIVRMDADTTSGKGAHQRLLERFAAEGPSVLLGTQMIAKGLDFDEVTLVGVINADTMLKLPDYRAAERTFSLIQQVAGRAGRAQLPGVVIVQTYEAKAPSICAAAAYDRAMFLRDELPKRRLGYPPYVRMANVLVWGSDEPDVRRVATEVQEGLEALVRDFGGGDWMVLPAMPCVLSRLRGSYRWHVVVKCPSYADLSSVLLRFFRQRKPDTKVNVAVDVDPDDLL